MPRGPAVDVEVRGLIEGLALKGRGAAEIYRHLEQLQQRRQLKGRLPTLRTVQRLVRDFAPPDTSARWTLADADPEESRAILDVLAVIIERTDGRVWPTRDLANWIVRVRAAAPTMDLWDVYVYATAYRSLTEQHREWSANQVDRLLAFKPWESEEAQQHFWSVMARLPSEDPQGKLFALGGPWPEKNVGEMNDIPKEQADGEAAR